MVIDQFFHHVTSAFQQFELHHNSNVRSQTISSMNRRGDFVANVSQVIRSEPTMAKCEWFNISCHKCCRNVLSTNRTGRGGGKGPARSYHGGRGQGRSRPTNVRANTPTNYNEATSGTYLNGSIYMIE